MDVESSRRDFVMPAGVARGAQRSISMGMGLYRTTAAARSISRVIQNPYARGRQSATTTETVTRQAKRGGSDELKVSSCGSSKSSSEGSAEEEDESDAPVEVMAVSSLDAVLEQRRKAAEEKGEVVDLLSSDTEDDKPSIPSKQKITVDEQGHEILWIDDDDDDDDGGESDGSSVVEVVEQKQHHCSECEKPFEKEGICDSCVKACSEASKAMDELERRTTFQKEEGEHTQATTERTEKTDPSRSESGASVPQQSKCGELRSDENIFDADTEESDEERERTLTTEPKEKTPDSCDRCGEVFRVQGGRCESCFEMCQAAARSTDQHARTSPGQHKMGSSHRTATRIGGGDGKSPDSRIKINALFSSPHAQIETTNAKQTIEGSTNTTEILCIECWWNSPIEGRDICTQCAAVNDNLQVDDWLGDIGEDWFNNAPSVPPVDAQIGNTRTAAVQEEPQQQNRPAAVNPASNSSTRRDMKGPPFTNPYKRRKTWV